MSDISKINPNGTEYNLKDAAARDGIESSKTLKSSVVTVTDAAPINAEDITVDITPIQDLHGYDRPWTGGAGKNKLQLDVDYIKAFNKIGTWNGNVYTCNGVTFTILTDDGGNVTGIKVNGSTSISSAVGFDVCRTSNIATGSYILNGCPSGGGGGATAYYMKGSSGSTYAYDNGSGANLTVGSSNLKVTIFVGNASNKVFYPMLRLSTETDATFAPYSNICPIEGRTGAELDRVGKNWLPKSQTASFSVNGVTVTNNDDGTYTTANSASAYGVCRVLEGKNIRRGSYILSGGFTTTDGVSVMLTPKNNDSVNIARSYGGDVAFTLDTDTEIDMYFTFRTHYPYAPTTIAPMIRLASITDSPYEPYQGEQYTASFGETVYGGKWHVTEGGTDKSKVSASGWVQYASSNGYKAYRIENLPVRNKDIFVTSDLMSNLVGEFGTFASGAMTKNIIQPPFGNFPTTAYMALREDIDPSTVQFLYDKDTPNTISTPKQNVPMLKGINTVSADCGDTQLKYQPDNVVGELKGEIEDNIVYEDFRWKEEGSITYSAGTPGTYATSTYRDVAKEGYDVIGVTFVENRQLGNCILTLNYIPSTKRVEVIIFRATSSSVTVNAEDIVYRVAYKKA